MPQQYSQWETSRNNFLKEVRGSLTDDEVRILENTDRVVVKDKLEKELRKHRPALIGKVLGKLEPFLEILNNFARSLDVISNVHQYASLTWGIMRIIIELGVCAIERLEKAFASLGDITRLLDRLLRTENLLQNNKKLQEVLGEAYDCILKFYLQVIKYLRKGFWNRILRFFQNSRDIYGTIFERLEVSIGEVEAEVQLAIAHTVEDVRGQLAANAGVQANPEPKSKIFNVQDVRGQNPIARQDIFENLERQFCSPSSPNSALQTACLYGTGGVGKSMIVQEFIHAQRSKFDWIFWVRADTEQKLHFSFLEIATLLGFSKEFCADKAWMIRSVKQQLSSTEAGWLLVFDNADNLDLIHEYWPWSGRGNVILTTRDSTATSKFTCPGIPVSQLSLEDGINFLKSLVPDSPSWPELHMGNDMAKDLVNEIGALPIALDHAAATLKAGGSIQSLLVQYRDPAQNKVFLEIDNGKPRAQREVLGKTWEASYKSLEVTSPEGAKVLQCLAWIDHDGLSKDILYPNEMLFLNATHYHATVQSLKKFCWITLPTSSDTLYVNRMVQHTTINLMTDEERVKAFCTAVKLLEAKFPQPYSSEGVIFPGVMEHTEDCKKLIPHVLSLVKNYENYFQGENIEKLGSLLQRAALYLLEIDNKQGERLLRMSLDMEGTEERYIVPHIKMTLAWNQMRYGNLGDAMELGTTSIELFEDSLGSQHVLTAWAYCNFGRILAFNAEFGKARRYHQKAIIIYQNAIVGDPQNLTLRFALVMAKNYLVTALHCQFRGNILGDIYEPSISIGGSEESIPCLIFTEQEREDLEETLVLCKKGQLELSKAQYGLVFPNKQTLAWIELTLSWILLDLGLFNEAEIYNSKALVHVKDRFIPDGCGVGVVTVQKADILDAQGKTGEAEEEYRKARSLLEYKMGRENPLTALAYHKTGNFYCRHKRFEEAAKSYEIALESLRNSYGESHPTTATTMNNLGIALVNIGQRESGKKLLERALEARAHRFRDSHKLVVRLVAIINFLDLHVHPNPEFREIDRHDSTSELVSELVPTQFRKELLAVSNLSIEHLSALTAPNTLLQGFEGVQDDSLSTHYVNMPVPIPI